MSELKPCPWCGGDAWVEDLERFGHKGFRYGYSHKPVCYLAETVHKPVYQTREEAIVACNTRAPDPDVERLVEVAGKLDLAAEFAHTVTDDLKEKRQITLLALMEAMPALRSALAPFRDRETPLIEAARKEAKRG